MGFFSEVGDLFSDPIGYFGDALDKLVTDPGDFFSDLGIDFGTATDAYSAYQSARAAERQQSYTDYYNQLAQQNFRDQLTSGIQYRVKDARAAGISPLAALGAPGASPVHFNTDYGRAGGTGGRGQAIAAAAFAGINSAQLRRLEAEEERTRAETNKLISERQRVDLQNAQAVRDLNQKKAETYGQSAAATKESQAPVTATKPLYKKWRDNRQELGPLGKGEIYLVDEEAAESLEGLGALTLGIGGTITAPKPLQRLRHPIGTVFNVEGKEYQLIQTRRGRRLRRVR